MQCYCLTAYITVIVLLNNPVIFLFVPVFKFILVSSDQREFLKIMDKNYLFHPNLPLNVFGNAKIGIKKFDVTEKNCRGKISTD